MHPIGILTPPLGCLNPNGLPTAGAPKAGPQRLGGTAHGPRRHVALTEVLQRISLAALQILHLGSHQVGPDQPSSSEVKSTTDQLTYEVNHQLTNITTADGWWLLVMGG